MIDFGLLLSLAAMLALPWVLSRFWRMPTLAKGSLFDIGTAPLLAGLVVGRVWAMALDNPTGLVRLRDLLVIRSGVEFWPGVAAGVAVAAWRARRDHVPPIRRLADLAPFALLAYAAYEAMCIVRDGCYGPPSAIGLVPGGLTTRMLPIGLIVALAMTCLAVATYRWWALEREVTVLAAVGGVALARTIASFWLPHLGDSLTRQHVTSLIVLGGGAAGLTGVVLATRHRQRALRAPTPDGER